MSATTSRDHPSLPAPAVPLTPPAPAKSEGGSSKFSSYVETTADIASGSAVDSDQSSPDTDDHNRPCTVQVVESPVFVVGLADDVYPSWAAWLTYLKNYSAETRQIIRILSTLSCDLRNKRLGKTVAVKQGMDVPYVPEEWGAYQRTYICTHGWPAKDRSTGLRPKHFFRGCGRSFRFVVQLVQNDGQWCLRVKNGMYQHNHAVGTAQFRTYAKSRTVDDTETKDAVDSMVMHGRKRGSGCTVDPSELWEHALVCDYRGRQAERSPVL